MGGHAETEKREKVSNRETDSQGEIERDRTGKERQKETEMESKSDRGRETGRDRKTGGE